MSSDNCPSKFRSDYQIIRNELTFKTINNKAENKVQQCINDNFLI